MATNISNINVRHRLTQVVVLILLILAGMLFSQVADARPKPKFDKHKYRIQVHKNSDRSCYILHKKRTSGPGRPLLSFHKHPRHSTHGLAETDGLETASK